MKKLISFLVVLFTLFSISSCGKNNEDEPIVDPLPEHSYTIKVIDLDDEVLGEKVIETSKYSNLYEAIQAEFEVDGSMSEYGAWINSINNSIVDPNYSLMLYVNGLEATSSADKVIPVDDVCYEFKNVCWQAIDYGYGTSFDSTDVLLDKVLYKYFKNQMKNSLENLDTFSGSTYWDMLTILAYKNNYLTGNAMNYTFKEELKNSIVNAKLTELSDNDLMKYYMHAKVLNLLNDSFSNIYQTKLDTLTTFNPYSTPLFLAPASYEGLTSTTFDTIFTSDFNADITFGLDANLWSFMSEQMFKDYSEYVNFNDYVKEWDELMKNCSTTYAMTIAAISSLGLDVRDTTIFNKVNDKDLLTYLLEKYYDDNLGFIKIYEDDTTMGMSTNQIYTYLFTYKVFRDNNKAYSPFGPINR